MDSVSWMPMREKGRKIWSKLGCGAGNRRGAANGARPSGEEGDQLTEEIAMPLLLEARPYSVKATGMLRGAGFIHGRLPLRL